MVNLVKNTIWTLVAGLGLLVIDNTQAQEFTASRRNTTESHVDGDGCTVTTKTEYVDSAYHGETKHDVFTTITTSRPQRSFMGDHIVVPAVYFTRTTDTIGDWIAPHQPASFAPSVPSLAAVQSPMIVYEGKTIPDASRPIVRPAATRTDDAAEYRKNIKNGTWKEFKNGE
jgi:hypothetical protein